MIDLLQAAVSFSLMEQGYKIGLDWLGHFARIIIEGVGIVGLGIIVFTLVLKAITLPFDIYQRVMMRKQNLIMQQMKPELEKLQKQYANDKTTYNQKMLELQKKSGYSLLGACLPMIISLVILIVAFSGFRTYSQYANLNLFVHMSEEYNSAILQYSAEGKDYHLPVEGAEADELTKEFVAGFSFTEDGIVYTMYHPRVNVTDENGKQVENGQLITEEDTNSKYMEVKSSDPSKFVYYVYSLGANGNGRREYQIDVDRLYEATDSEEVKQMIAANRPDPADTTVSAVTARQEALNKGCNEYIISIGAQAAATYFRESDSTPSFLWIGNVWYPDVSYDHPIPSYSDFASQLNEEITFDNGTTGQVAQVLDEARYNALTSQLTEEKDRANGYFILIILSIALMVVSQLVVMKSSKEANKYQTVDGQGANTQKVMLVVMPLIYAIFAFMYSAAFSIYMCMSSVVAILVTLISNFALGKVFSKKEEKAFREANDRTLPWMKKDEDGKKKGKKK